MNSRFAATALASLLLMLLCAVQALAQGLPQECQEAQEVRSPQSQIELLTRCLETGRVSGNEKATAIKQRAIAYMHLGQHQRAIDDINQALRINSGDADNYYLRAVSQRALGNHRQSVEDSSRAIGLEPDFAAAYANRAYSQKALGNVSQARNDARRAHDLDSRVRVPSF